ncbi:hypothetical protein E5355_00635 [Bacteroides muris (ex Afrizal et al. 2022)]|uniref:Uncharacterized protein n=1 Tax=Bacteroides muris (ex Afrizal et al. 2022) TaxID=2516960 RepID=A0A4V3RCR2_9BACE|nr:hypothetical protein E5355_00635 [Bacteroides muris (ex Afrizal et al. 2022)]
MNFIFANLDINCDLCARDIRKSQVPHSTALLFKGVIGEFLQRRINFLVSALGSINLSEFSKAAHTIHRIHSVFFKNKKP